MTIKELQEKSYKQAVASGWWDVMDLDGHIQYVVGTKLGLIHSEISEALEGYRKGKNDEHLPHRLSIEVELADAMIRIADLAGALCLDLEGAIDEKMEYNAIRADHKPSERAKEGGKKI